MNKGRGDLFCFCSILSYSFRDHPFAYVHERITHRHLPRLRQVLRG